MNTSADTTLMSPQLPFIGRLHGKLKKGTLGEKNLFKWQILSRTMSARNVVVISRIRMVENLGRGLRRETEEPKWEDFHWDEKPGDS